MHIYHLAANSSLSPLSSRLTPLITTEPPSIATFTSSPQLLSSPISRVLQITITMSGFAQLAQILADPEAYNMTYAQAFETVAEAIIVPSKPMYLGPHIMG